MAKQKKFQVLLRCSGLSKLRKLWLKLGGSALRNSAVLSSSVSTLTGCLWDPRSILSIMLASPVDQFRISPLSPNICLLRINRILSSSCSATPWPSFGQRMQNPRIYSPHTPDLAQYSQAQKTLVLINALLDVVNLVSSLFGYSR